MEDKLIEAGVKNLRVYGYPQCDKHNILTDRIYNPDRKSYDASKCLLALKKALLWSSSMPLICSNLPDFYQSLRPELLADIR